MGSDFYWWMWDPYSNRVVKSLNSHLVLVDLSKNLVSRVWAFDSKAKSIQTSHRAVKGKDCTRVAFDHDDQTHGVKPWTTSFPFHMQ